MDRNELRQILQKLLEEETMETFDQIEDSTKLREELELDSVDTISVVLNIHSRFGIEIENDELEGLVTVGDLLDLIENKLPSASSRDAA